MQIKENQASIDLPSVSISVNKIKWIVFSLLNLLLACSNSRNPKLEYYQDGSIRTASEIVDDSIVLIKEYYPNQVVKNVRTIVHGKRKGISQSFNLQGVMIAQTRWLNDKQYGLSVYHFPSGRMSKVVNFVDGLRLGEYKEYYDIEGSPIRLSANYISVEKKDYLNEYYKYNQTGQIIDRSPTIKASYKTDNTQCISHIALRVINPSFPHLEATIANYDQDYNLRSLSNLRRIIIMGDSTTISINLVGVNDTIVRGKITNFRITGKGKAKSIERMNKDFYWQIAIKGCQKRGALLAIAD